MEAAASRASTAPLLKSAARRFAITYGINAVVVLVKILSRRSGRQQPLPLTLLEASLDRSNAAAGGFVAAFGLIYHLARGKLEEAGLLDSSPARAAVAGGAAGASMLALFPACVGGHLDPPTLALHALVRATAAAYRQSPYKNSIPHADAAVFIVGAALSDALGGITVTFSSTCRFHAQLSCGAGSLSRGHSVWATGLGSAAWPTWMR
jgi:hypothetical protein